jgi:hypothetical protein
MSVVKYILSEELHRLEQLSQQYADKIKRLQKGSISVKGNNGNKYAYLAFRDGDKVRFKYIGRESSQAAKKMMSDRQQRLAYIIKLKEVNNNIKEIKCAIRAIENSKKNSVYIKKIS